jgi:hypothetical protein
LHLAEWGSPIILRSSNSAVRSIALGLGRAKTHAVQGLSVPSGGNISRYWVLPMR